MGPNGRGRMYSMTAYKDSILDYRFYCIARSTTLLNYDTMKNLMFVLDVSLASDY